MNAKFQIPKTEVNLKIADVIIRMQSRFPLEQLTKEEEQTHQAAERYKNFFYKGRQIPHIVIKVEIVDRLPEITKANPVFITRHFQDGSENWRLLRKDNTYIYKSPLKDKKQLMLVNEAFNRVTAYLLPKEQKIALTGKRREFIKDNKGFVWNTSDIIYDFLQVLLINYLAVTRKDGIFTHSMGVKDISKNGLLFTGKSGAGKSTLARTYYKHSKALVLNDDRIVVRKIKNDFYIYGSPWHGDFSDYLMSRIEKAKLKGIFFLQKAKENSVKAISSGKAFKFLYPAMFPTFWDRKGTQIIALFLSELLSEVDCFRLKFRKDKSVIDFVRRINFQTAKLLD